MLSASLKLTGLPFRRMCVCVWMCVYMSFCLSVCLTVCMMYVIGISEWIVLLVFVLKKVSLHNDKQRDKFGLPKLIINLRK